MCGKTSHNPNRGGKEKQTIVKKPLITLASSMLLCLIIIPTVTGITLYKYNVSVNARVNGRYVYVENGHFYTPDGRRLVLFAADIYGNTSTFINAYKYAGRNTPPTWLEAIASYGFNTIVLIETNGYLDPVYGGALNSTQLSLMDSFINSAWSHGLYTIIDYPGPLSDCRWVTSDKQAYNLTYRNETIRVWGLLAQHYANNPAVIGYQIPGPELAPIPTGSLPYMNGQDNITVAWNIWLKKKFGTIDKLNATWNYNSISWLNSSLGENVFISSYDDHQPGIRLPYSYRTQTSPTNDWRIAEWHEFLGEWMYNYTSAMANQIRKFDGNHVIIYHDYTTNVAPARPYAGRVAYPKLIPTSIGAIECTAYPLTNKNDSSFAINMFAGYAPCLSLSSCNESKAVLLTIDATYQGNGPNGKFPNANQVSWWDNLLAQAYFWGVDGIIISDFYAFFAYSNANPDPWNLPFWDKIVPEWAQPFRDGTPERNVTIALISGENDLSRSIGETLLKNGVRFTNLPFNIGDDTPEVLNKFEALIVDVRGASNKTLNAVNGYANSGRGWVLYTLFDSWYDTDEHAHRRDQLVNWGSTFFKAKTSASKYNTQNLNLVFSSNFGDINYGSSFNVTTWLSNPANITKSVLRSGIQIIANFTYSGKTSVALLMNSTAHAIYYDDSLAGSSSNGRDVVIRSFLETAGILPLASVSEGVASMDNSRNGYGLVMSHLQTDGNYSVKFPNVDPAKMYTIYEINPHDGSTVYNSPILVESSISGLMLRKGWNVSVKALETRLFKFQIKA